MHNYKSFVKVMGILIIIMFLVVIGANYVLINKNASILFIVGIITEITSISILCSVIFSLIVSYLVLKNIKINSYLMKINFKIVTILYIPVNFFSKVFKISKEDIRRIYILLNNAYVYSCKYKFNCEDILAITPHCIQKNICTHKITNNIQNCKRCGKCSVMELLELKEKYNINVFVATGGTLARKIIKDNRPKAIIAIACERDLISGITDIKNIPVIGILNERPNGPCFDTTVSVAKIENAIQFYLGGV